MVITEKDFIELEFSAKVRGGDLFDSSKEVDAKLLGVEPKYLKPIIISVGASMVVSGLDKDLIGKEIKKDYTIELPPEDAFGKRDPKLVQMVPMSNFKNQKIIPQRGMQFSFDGRLARVASVSGGRVLVDFNNPLAGKTVIYEYNILRKVEDKKEKIDALQEFFFKRKFDAVIDGDSVKISIDKNLAPIFELMKKRLEDISGLRINFNIKEDKK